LPFRSTDRPSPPADNRREPRGVDQAAWDRYILSHPGAAPYHLYGWQKVVESAYGHVPWYLTVTGEASNPAPAIRGVLPLVHFCSPDTEGRLISLPFLDCAGLLADDPGAEKALVTRALEMVRELGAAHLEIRQDHPGDLLTENERTSLGSGFTYAVYDFKVGLRRSLPGTAEELWGLLPAKVRNQIRKARRSGCTGRIGGEEMLDDFYEVFSRNMRDLGSPVHARRFFAEIFHHFPEQARIILVEREGISLAAALVFGFGETLYNPWASSLRSFRPLCPNMLLYWEMLSHACQQGLRSFDFGRSSPGAPTCVFKLQWGARMRPLRWHVFSRHAEPWHPQRETLVIEYWKSFDLTLSRQLGPELRRFISL
jgi:FemAB-related protein (PEP-CTERM system-associated)